MPGYFLSLNTLWSVSLHNYMISSNRLIKVELILYSLKAHSFILHNTQSFKIVFVFEATETYTNWRQSQYDLSILIPSASFCKIYYSSLHTGGVQWICFIEINVAFSLSKIFHLEPWFLPIFLYWADTSKPMCIYIENNFNNLQENC